MLHFTICSPQRQALSSLSSKIESEGAFENFVDAASLRSQNRTTASVQGKTLVEPD